MAQNPAAFTIEVTDANKRTARQAYSVNVNLPIVGNAFWPQWGGNPQHTGFAQITGQLPNRIAANIVYDPFVAQEEASNSLGALLVHYQVPLTAGDDVFMEFKNGNWVPCNPPRSGTPAPCDADSWNSQIWNEKRLHWSDGQLIELWNFQSDWKPEPNAGLTRRVEPVFQPALANGFVYVPGAGGKIWKINADDGSVVNKLQPFGAAIDPNTFVAGPLSADAQGNIFYNAIRLSDPQVVNPWTSDVLGAWLVKIAPDDSVTSATFSSLFAAGVSLPATCTMTFNTATDPKPWPPTPKAVPKQGPCGSQRPGLNIAPAIAPDGTVYTISRAHLNEYYSYLIAINPDLTPKWFASLRGRLKDGCGVTIPYGNSTNDCRTGATLGVDPATNDLPAGRVGDDESSSPTILPDGSLIYAAYTIYNGGRGHLMKFNSTGQFQATFDFGQDDTVAVYPHNGTYSIITKDNHYNGNEYITQLDPNLAIEWQFLDPNSAEWCVNMPMVDSNGTVYANSEDGNLYVIGSGNAGVFSTPLKSLFLLEAPGAAYTPISMGPDGKIYSQVAGHLFAATD
jgi:outer membrane protein assembly factor BamB